MPLPSCILSLFAARTSTNAVRGISLPRKRRNDGLQQHAEARSQTWVKTDILLDILALCSFWTQLPHMYVLCKSLDLPLRAGKLQSIRYKIVVWEKL